MMPEFQAMTWNQIALWAVGTVLFMLLVPFLYALRKWVKVLEAKADTILGNIKVNTDVTLVTQGLAKQAAKDRQDQTAATDVLANNLAQHEIQDNERHTDNLAVLKQLTVDTETLKEGQRNHADAMEKLQDSVTGLQTDLQAMRPNPA